MQDNKCCPYSFYVPAKDKALCQFIEAQSNLSMSIRLLLKAFIANYDGEYPDVTVMDLRELMENMTVEPEKVLETVAAEKKSVPAARSTQAVSVDNSLKEDVSEKESSKEEIIDVSEKIKEEQPEKEEIQDSESKIEQDSVNQESLENVSEQPDVEPENEDKKENTSDTESDPSETNDEDIVPNIVVEPETPKKTVGSSRDSYNNRQNGDSEATMDDIMSLMGDM